MSNIVRSKGYQHGKAVPYISRPHLTPLFILIVFLILCLQLFIPPAAYARTAAHPFCNSGTHTVAKHFHWTENGKTDYYFGDIHYDINSSCTQVTLDTAYIEYTSSPAFVSWWDHNQYAGGSWDTGCPVVSRSGNSSQINSGGWQAGYYFQEYASDNGCNWLQENLVYWNIGPLVD